jgi:hypothetical protein
MVSNFSTIKDEYQLIHTKPPNTTYTTTNCHHELNQITTTTTTPSPPPQTQLPLLKSLRLPSYSLICLLCFCLGKYKVRSTEPKMRCSTMLYGCFVMFCYALRKKATSPCMAPTSHYACLPLALSGAAPCASGLVMISMSLQDVCGCDRGRHP